MLKKRIVSLLPSATEIVCELGLRDSLVGVTHECDYPPSVVQLPKVTQTVIPHDATSSEIDQLVRERLKTKSALYSLNESILEQLEPDLIVTQSLCDVCAVAEEEVRQASCRLTGNPQVINLEPSSLEDVFECMRHVGEACGVKPQAQEIIENRRKRVEQVTERSRRIAHRPRVVVLEWIDPPFCAGHWSPELVRLAGGIEAIGTEGTRSRTVCWEDIVAAEPDVLLIACCGFNVPRTLQDIPVLREYPGFHELGCTAANRVYVVDGNAYFSRPGPRLVDSLELLAHMLHPEHHPFPAGAIPPIAIGKSEPKSET